MWWGCVAGGACMAGGCTWHRGCAWQGRACVAGGVHGRGACVARGGGMCGRVCTCVTGEMATAAGSMHPTGMHSCS